MADALVVGGGLAGCEAAWQLAQRGHTVRLVEMRPGQRTPAHQTDQLAELVCTNSFKSEELSNAHGLIKAEMRALGSILLSAADQSRVPAGSALAVDRQAFSARVTAQIAAHPAITIERAELRSLPDGPAVIATGPLTSDALSSSIAQLLGSSSLAFYDSIAPIVAGESIDRSIAFGASRWDRGGDDDYLNCPFTADEYAAFLAALQSADVYPGHDWENVPYFEGCLPIEVMASRGADTLRFGPMRPIGLRDPRTGKRPYAVLQLRREDRAGQLWNLVGFQTRLRTGDQRRVFRMVPGLESAEFLRFGSIHRNTYLNFPLCLNAYGANAARPDLIFAGQLTGVEGYMESAASGIVAGLNLDRVLRGQATVIPPSTTMMGALFRYLAEAPPDRFQPMNSNFGLLDPIPGAPRNKDLRREQLVSRARAHFMDWLRDAAAELPVPALADLSA